MKKFTTLYILTLILGACSSPAIEENTEVTEESNRFELSEQAMEAIGLEYSSPETRSLHTVLDVSGILDVPPEQKQSITLSYPGKITRIPLINGMHVHKGDLLFAIENPAFIAMQEEYLIAKSNLELAEKNLARQQVLSQGKVNAEKDLDQAKNEVDRLTAQKNALIQNLLLININPAQINAQGLSAQVKFYADANYWVQQVNVNKGSYAVEGSVVMELINLEHIHLELAVFEKDIHRLKIGQNINFQLPNETIKREAEVYLISRNVKADRTIQVHAHLEKEDSKLLPGTFVQAQIQIQQDSALTIAASALQQYQGKYYLFERIDEGAFEMVEIAKPEQIEDWIYVEPSFLNRQFAVKGTFQLLSSLKNTSEEE